MLLFHGTTLARARRILRDGPDPNFMEPGGVERAGAFCTCTPFGPFDPSGLPEDYALGKAAAALREGRREGGPAIVIVDVPEDVIALAVTEYLPVSQGFVDFDEGYGLEELLAAWSGLPKRVISFTGATG